MDKQQLRNGLLQKRKSMSAHKKAQIEQAMQILVLQDVEYAQANIVSCYLAMDHEWSTKLIVEDAFQHGKAVCVPRCRANGKMHMHRIVDFKDALVRSAFGVLEPRENCPIVDAALIDYMVVPALACSPTGHRLGYGKGFYDRYLCDTRAHTSILCMQEDIINGIPEEIHDQACEKIVTEKQVIRVNET